MYIKQLSVFIENREGRLEEVLSALKAVNVNIVSLSLADTSEFGMLRMIVDNPEEGKKALKEKGMSAMLTEVMVIKMAHRVGYLQELLGLICKAGINIEYMYSLSNGTDDASIVLKTSDLDKVKEVLEKSGVDAVTNSEISALSNES